MTICSPEPTTTTRSLHPGCRARRDCGPPCLPSPPLPSTVGQAHYAKHCRCLPLVAQKQPCMLMSLPLKILSCLRLSAPTPMAGAFHTWITMWTAVTLLLLVGHSMGFNLHPDDKRALGILDYKECHNVVINDEEQLRAYGHCTVIDGWLHIMDIGSETPDELRQYSFRNLREITGHLMMFNVSGLSTLRTLFPNLAVIRGQELFSNEGKALAILSMPDLEELGLVSLTVIQRGSVWLADNPKLCHAQSIDWKVLAPSTDIVTHEFLENKPEEMCSNNCSAFCFDTTYNGVTRSRCWTDKSDGCQRYLDCSCPDGQFCAPNGSCCHPECLGGCSGSSAKSCFACRTVLHGGECLTSCPRGTYMYSELHKCLTLAECLNLVGPTKNTSNCKSFSSPPKLLEGPPGQTSMCVFDCPKGYMEEKSTKDSITRCIKCQGPCHRVCSEMHIHSSVHELQQLKYCRVIEGSLHITLVDFVSQYEYDQYSFPELREITGHFMMFRVFGLRTLRNLFPNLAVIRGQTLFFNYALIILELRDLEEVGLVSLTSIVNGAVRLTKNFKLCYINTIDWKKIARGVDPSAHQFHDNREEGMCPDFCNSSCAVSKYDGHSRKRCWTSAPDGCQKTLECKCAGGQPCLPDGRCCHPYCIGGCSGPTPSDCFACKNVLYKNTCQPECPPATYMFAHRRCLLDQECLSPRPQRNGQTIEEDSPGLSKLLDGSGDVPSQCLFKCPEGFTPSQNAGSTPTHCVACQGFCPKICHYSQVFSVQDSIKFRGCRKIEGPLEIQINGGDDIDSQLTENLGLIQEVTGYIKIVRSYGLLTLHFFKSLEIIGGKRLMNSNYSLTVMDNINLQELFPESQMKKMVIERGLINIHGNRKLCFYKIEHFFLTLKSMPKGNKKWLEINNINNSINGNQIPCKELTLNLTITQIVNNTVQFGWDSYIRGTVTVGNQTYGSGDSRQLLNYVTYYREAAANITDIFEGRDACSDNDWVIHYQKMNFSYLTNLKPYTRYALYVQAHTLSTATMAARSPIVYFRTKPAEPSEPIDLEVSSNDPNKLDVRWKPPKSPNGVVTHYKVFYTLQKFNVSTFEQRDYCTNPISKSSEEVKKAKAKKLKEEEKLKAEDKDQTCCKCPKKEGDQEKEEEIIEKEISFENFLQTKIFRKLISDDCLDRIVNGTDDNDSANYSKAGNEELSAVSIRKRRNANMSSDLGSERSVALTTPSFKQTHATMLTKEILVYGTKVMLGNLEHFSYYNIEVVACHELDPKTGTKLCGADSTSAMTTCQTKPNHPFDMIKESTISVLQEANKIGEVFIHWQPPQSPNGPVLKYTIKYQRIFPEPKGHPVVICVSRQQYVNHSQGYVLAGLEPGNYSFQISAHTLAGNGSYSQNSYFVIAALPESASDNTSTVVGTVCGVLGAVVISILVIFYIRSRQSQRSDTVSSNPHYLHTDDFYAPDEWEVDRDDIRLIKELGQGSFGMVFEGSMEDKEASTSTKVAIKTVNDKADFIERWKILKEATTMKVFECHHVVKLLGVVSKGQPALVILELMALGDLRNYLRRSRIEEEDYPDMTPPSSNKIRQMAGEIADGMAYLADKKIVHRDLAARNCLVAEDTTVKIADFGMARDVYLTEYYRKDQRALLPIRWMAPESLHDGVFTTMSDIWSYGVVLWEMVTLAEQPYQGLGNEQVLKFVSEGHLMNEPEGCPEDLNKMMQKCWAFNPRNRPTFKYIIEMLVPYLNSRFHEVSYFFQEVVHSDGEDNMEDCPLEEKRDEMEGDSDDGVEEEDEDDEEDDDEQGIDDEDRARFEEEKLIKGNYNLYASSSGDEDGTIQGSPGSSLSHSTTPASSLSQAQFMAPSSPKPFGVSPRDHRASPKTFKGRQSSPLLLEQGAHQQPLLYPRPSSSSTKDHRHSSNSPERLWYNNSYVDPYADAKGDGVLDSLHIDEEEPSSEHLKLLPKSDGPRLQSDRHGGRGLSKLPPRSSYKPSSELNSDDDSQYTLMLSPTSSSKSMPLPPHSENIPISPLSPPVNPILLHPAPLVPSSSSLSPSSSSPSPLSSKLSSSSSPTAATSGMAPPFSLAPLSVTAITEPTPPQSKSKPTLHLANEEDAHPPKGGKYSGHPAVRNRKSGSDVKWRDVFQNNNMVANNREGGNSARGALYSDSSDVDSITSGSRHASEGSGSKESSSSTGSHHHLAGGTANGHGPYSCQPAALC